MISPGAEVYLATRPVDLRKSFDALSGIVKEKLRHDPRSGSLFFFYNKRRNRLKVLFFDRTGYCLLYKRLDRGCIQLPTVIDPCAEELKISADEMVAMLRGLDLDQKPRAISRPKKVKNPVH